MLQVADHSSAELQENTSIVPVAFTSKRDDVKRSSRRRRRLKRISSAIPVAIDDDDDEEEEELPPKNKSRKITLQEVYGPKWEAKFQLLLKYENKHGDTLVPKRYAADSKFGRWVHRKRAVYDKNKLLDHRVRRLNSIGFVWTDVADADKQYQMDEYVPAACFLQRGTQRVDFGSTEIRSRPRTRTLGSRATSFIEKE